MKVCAAPALAGPVLAAVVLATLCVPAAGEEFPVRARLSGGPAQYTVGSLPQVFSLELAATSGSGLSRRVHAVLMLIDNRRALRPPQIVLEYADGAGRWHAESFQHTDDDENVAVLGGEDGPGTVVPARGTVTVKLRLRFKPGTPAVGVTASATVMQRRGDDGDWVGESKPYAFRTVPARPASPGRRPSPGRPPERPAGSERPADPASSAAPEHPAVAADPTEATRTGPALTDSARNGRIPRTGSGTRPHWRTPPALAATGATRSPAGLSTTAAALLLIGVALLSAVRQRRRSGRGHG
jgi:hypothetical protein